MTPSPRSHAIIAINVLSSILATTVVFIRLFTRSKLLHSVGIDDWLILVGLGSAWVLALWNSVGTAWGLGRHVWDVPEENWVGVAKIIWGTTSLYFPILGFIKLSILFSLRRITPSAFGRHMIYYTMAFIILLTISVTFANTFQCNPSSKIYTPVPGRAWVEWGDSHEGTCINRPVLFYVSGGLNVLSDLVILAIPMPMLLGLGWPWRQKVALVGVFSLGGIACIASFARLGVLHELLYSPDLTVWLLRVIYKYSITSCLEISLGIICASMPSLKPFLVKYLPSLLGTEPHWNHVRGSDAWSFGSSVVQRGANNGNSALGNVDESAIGGPGRGGRLGTGRLSWYSEQVLKAEEEARRYQAMQDAEEAVRKKLKKSEEVAPKRISTWKSLTSSISRSATHLSRSATRKKERGSVATNSRPEKQYDPAVDHGALGLATITSNHTVPPLPSLPPLPTAMENNTTDSATVTTNTPHSLSNNTLYITAPPPTSRKYKSLPYKLSTSLTQYQSLPDSDSEYFQAHQSFAFDPSPISPLQRLGTWGKSKFQQLRGEMSYEYLPPPSGPQYTMSRRDDSDNAMLMLVPKGAGEGMGGSREGVVSRMDIDEEMHIENETRSLIKGAAEMGMGAGERGKGEGGEGGNSELANKEQPEMRMPVPESPLQVTMGFRLDGPGELSDFTYY
ncbi:hypothetical protein L211DRAFT_865541 [Terfezia boudieri ATCC MYA-4762]|uniref:Rhodopsin domain-containing protein n=1 Tax=Terfezia boudieri ATCC MYA-4762 TaxID=1051890 RepID=A0A3N4LWP3_9PEZI|nr:hypothetical protein L211DRAFT_865541 [Terfezia boudieri ATCC MYA-4762]